MHIILIEDEEILNEFITHMLKKNGYKVNSYKNLKSFLSSFYDFSKVDLIIADISLPDGNFLEEMKKYPHIVKNSKIIIMSAQTNIENIKKSFILGADDFIKKPFDCEEILLRINKLFSKNKNELPVKNGIYYNFNSKSIIKDKSQTILSKKEAELLELFLKNRGIVLTKEYIMEEIWDDIIPSNTLTVLIKRVREKIGDKNIIISKKDLGYIMF